MRGAHGAASHLPTRHRGGTRAVGSQDKLCWAGRAALVAFPMASALRPTPPAAVASSPHMLRSSQTCPFFGAQLRCLPSESSCPGPVWGQSGPLDCELRPCLSHLDTISLRPGSQPVFSGCTWSEARVGDMRLTCFSARRSHTWPWGSRFTREPAAS